MQPVEAPGTGAPRPGGLVGRLLQGLVRRRSGWRAWGLCAGGSLLVLASGVIHLHLWATGYDVIPSIGPLFLIQSVSAFVFAAGLLLWPSLIASLSALGLAVGTVSGFLLTVSVGLFGFSDSFSAPYATLAFADELGAVAVLLCAGLALASRGRVDGRGCKQIDGSPAWLLKGGRAGPS
jgi:hypothetical protein